MDEYTKLGAVLDLIYSIDRLKIYDQNNNSLYIGYKGLFNFNDDEVKEAGLSPDLPIIRLGYTHEVVDKHWKENGLLEPLEPKTIPDKIYADLEERIYLYIKVQK